jgi:hypothetical protein
MEKLFMFEKEILERLTAGEITEQEAQQLIEDPYRDIGGSE